MTDVDSDPAIEEAYDGVDEAYVLLAELEESIPQLEAEGEWSAEAIEGVNHRLEEIRKSIAHAGGEVARAQVALDRVREDGETA
ncbi:hypothetical protein HLRTI_002166 [Halorhabdus tiamatea SARL4B]|uniref:Uncharacterized protein n=1 Tax=Halorhabdus tiamatea SARL4B TaxID=1033806 RepID=F7PJF6_9EURY|nr:hypothetical protein [Halorhabdus tiamatea]ERJ05778.1 hypothetical protein HLRTI_002166 [Halorhabdus tiamatea SARL4B]CCQ34288.1 hypothetical protein HTIA_2176 [Halorhabdus tiamatea SARL4B]